MPDLIHLEDPNVAVRVCFNRRARRLTLRLATAGGGAVLTLPPGVPATEAENFVLRQSEWLRAAIGRQGLPVPVVAGALLPVDGLPRRVEVCSGQRRAPLLAEDRLVVSGVGRPAPRISAWLKDRARGRLAPLAAGLARQLGVSVTRIAFKDTRSRWGSCSSAGRINLSWRLAMAPLEVQDYVTAHEVAHLVEMNHGPRYWAVLERLMPGFEAPQAWLRANGAGLHRYRFD